MTKLPDPRAMLAQLNPLYFADLAVRFDNPAARLALLDAYVEGADTEARLAEPENTHALHNGHLHGAARAEAFLALWRYYGNTDAHLERAIKGVFGPDAAELPYPWLNHWRPLTYRITEFGQMAPGARLAAVRAFVDGARSAGYQPAPEEIWDEALYTEESHHLQSWRHLGQQCAMAIKETQPEMAGTLGLIGAPSRDDNATAEEGFDCGPTP